MRAESDINFREAHTRKNHIKLQAGDLSVIYEEGNLRYISAGNSEIIRMIYSAVRDRKWLNIDPEISEEVHEISSGSFKISYKCHYSTEEIDFLAHYTIKGNPDNSIVFSFEGEALKTFEKNRIGICVLHPVEGYAGSMCQIIHSNDEIESAIFPVNISPHQPFTDIKSMKWNIDEYNCQIDFFGEIFETEDQRNWTDASYKTYCTPLGRPFPETMRKGEHISQRVELKVDGDSRTKKTNDKIIKISVSDKSRLRIPPIGVGRSTRPGPLTRNEVQILRNLKFDHYRVDLHLFEPGWLEKADIAAIEAKKLGYKLEFALFFDDRATDMALRFIEWALKTGASIDLILIFHRSESTTPDCVADSLSRRFKAALPGIKIASGTNANFTQINRYRPSSIFNDLICYSIHPQEHASDNTTLVENLMAQQYTVESARNFANGKGILVSPVNIQRRFNANTEYYEQPFKGDKVPPQVDSRLMSLFGACWTVGSLKYLFESEVSGVTYYETAGERGIIQGDHPSRWPDHFPSVKGMLFPVYFVFDFILKSSSYKVVRSRSYDPLKVDCLVLTNGKNSKCILANHTSGMQFVVLQGFTGIFNLTQLNAKSYSEAIFEKNWLKMADKIEVDIKNTLSLVPFSVSFLEEAV
jgi:hypothetical protein